MSPIPSMEPSLLSESSEGGHDLHDTKRDIIDDNGTHKTHRHRTYWQTTPSNTRGL